MKEGNEKKGSPLILIYYTTANRDTWVRLQGGYKVGNGGHTGTGCFAAGRSVMHA